MNIFKASTPIRVGNFSSAPSDVSAGSIYYDTGSSKLFFANGSSYAAISTGGGGTTFLTSTFALQDTTDPTKQIQFDATAIATSTIRTIAMPDANVDLGNLTNSNISASAAIAYSKLSLTSSVVNADIASGAAIALSKLAAVTASRVLVSDGSGLVSASSVTSTTLGFLDATSSIQTQLNATEKTANKGVANGYASLDSGGKVPVAQLPNTVFQYQGAWDASTNTPTLSDATGTPGYVYRTSVAGTQDLGSGPITFNVGDLVIYSGTVWQLSPAADGVSSVNGSTGAVTVNAINQLTSDVTAGPASGSASAASTVAAIQGTTVSGTTGTGNVVFATSPTITTPTFSGTATGNISGTASNITGVLPILNGGTGTTTKGSAFDGLAPTSTQGDVIVYNSSGGNVRLGVGTNGQILTADSTATNGVKWAAGPSGGIAAVIDDPSPTLGGPLSLNNQQIYGNQTYSDTSGHAGSGYTYQVNYFNNITLLGGQTGAAVAAGAFDFPSRFQKNWFIDYQIFDVNTNARRCGRVVIALDQPFNTASTTSGYSITDTSTETGDVGVTFVVNITGGGNFQFQYNSGTGTKFMNAVAMLMLTAAGE